MMPGRAPKRIRSGSAGRKPSRGGSFRTGRRDSQPQTEELGLAHYSQTTLEPEYGTQHAPSYGFLLGPAGGIPPPGKMLLPPLPKSRAAHSGSPRTEKNRTSHACDKCRKAKAKCSGGQPCDKCRNEAKECVYGDGKRDKEKK
jgi:hypothetical protein